MAILWRTGHWPTRVALPKIGTRLGLEQVPHLVSDGSLGAKAASTMGGIPHDSDSQSGLGLEQVPHLVSDGSLGANAASTMGGIPHDSDSQSGPLVQSFSGLAERLFQVLHYSNQMP